MTTTTMMMLKVTRQTPAPVMTVVSRKLQPLSIPAE
jgi:hypothetical protein